MSQFELFSSGPEQPTTAPSVDQVRVRLEGLLLTLRTAEVMPLTSKQIVFWRTVVPQMSNWLPHDEQRAVCAEFEAEMARLERKAA